MEAAWVQDFLQWVNDHPTLAAVVIFLTGFTESLFLFGLLVPGAVLVFAFGTLIAADALEFWPTFFWLVLGAMLGDHFSYFLGYKLRNGIKRIWPLSRFPKVVQSGEDFFAKHGGKGVILGRFIGALRPVVPTVAGAAGMRPLHFFIMDALAMGPWIIAYMLPGVIFGASLNLAAEVGTRLLVMLLIVSLGLLVIVWLSRGFFVVISTHAETLTNGILDWSQRHRRLGLLGPNLADPAQPETPGLAILAIILLFYSWVAYGLLWGWTAPHTPADLDAAVYNLIQNLQSPWVDTLALAIAQFGTWQVYLPVSIAVLAGLLAAKRPMAAAHWCAALAFGAVVAAGLTLLMRIPTPVDYYRGNTNVFLTGHLIMSTVCYGFLAVLLATGKDPRRRWRYYGTAITGIVLIALARLYIGAQWFSDVLLGVGVGMAWVGMLSLGYRRHLPQKVASLSQMPLAMTVLILAAAAQWFTALEDDRNYYLPEAQRISMSANQWRSTGFEKLPAYRIDLAERRRYPLNLQWHGELDSIENELSAKGWQARHGFEFKQALLWLSKSRPVEELALLPQAHDGRLQALAMTLRIDDEREWVLRLWHSGYQIQGQPLWLGSIAAYSIGEVLDNLRVPAILNDFSTGPSLLFKQLDRGILVKHPLQETNIDNFNWDGKLILLSSQSR
ncbi:MAG: VTT domain-containing protein [Salinisphaeraceae bacterium]|nr:VTT domain-containing protein [Salinisphaeraceae bacterium]